MSTFDLDAELAAFSAEVETLAEQVPITDNTSTPAAAAAAATQSAATTGGHRAGGASNANGTAATAAASSAASAAAASSTSAAAAAVPQASDPALVGQKRKATAASEPASKKRLNTPSFIMAAEAAPADPSQQQREEAVGGVYSDVVSADLAALQQRQAAAAHSAAAPASHSTAAAAAGTDASAAAAASSAASGVVGGYIPGRVYNGWLASVHPVTGAPMWVEATPEQIAAAAANDLIEAQAAADAAAAAAAAAKKAARKERKAAAKIGGVPLTSGGIASGADAVTAATQEKHHLRTAAGKVWDDPTLQDWPENDYRLFCGDLGNEVSDQLLAKLFERFSSFARAKVVRDKRSGKSKGFGFVSFTDAGECITALKECDGKYVGNRPIRLKKSDWQKREPSLDKTWTAQHNKFGNATTTGNRKLHLY